MAKSRFSSQRLRTRLFQDALVIINRLRCEVTIGHWTSYACQRMPFCILSVYANVCIHVYTDMYILVHIRYIHVFYTAYMHIGVAVLTPQLLHGIKLSALSAIVIAWWRKWMLLWGLFGVVVLDRVWMRDPIFRCCVASALWCGERLLGLGAIDAYCSSVPNWLLSRAPLI